MGERREQFQRAMCMCAHVEFQLPALAWIRLAKRSAWATCSALNAGWALPEG